MIPGKARNKQLNGGAPDNWNFVKPSISRTECNRQDMPLIYAIVSSWHDGDIIYDTVRNCFNNGCEKVFLLDNNSPDDSVSEAVRAGAEIAEIYDTEYYDDDLRIRKQNDFIRTIVEKYQHRELWFLALDGDEFPTGHGIDTIQQTLGRLPGEIRTIGSKGIDLYPQKDERHIIGQHPASCYSHGINRIARFACDLYHWKHVALRYFHGVFDIAQTRGNHRPASRVSHRPLYEPATLSLPIFHAPMRNEENARARLTALCGKKNEQGNHRSVGDDQVIDGQGAIKRFHSLDMIYSQQWDKVELPHSQMYGRHITGICPYPWQVLCPGLEYEQTYKLPILQE